MCKVIETSKKQEICTLDLFVSKQAVSLFVVYFLATMAIFWIFAGC